MMRTIFLPHAAAAIIVTALTGLIFVSVQQSYRMGANDPQIQIARDVAYRLQQGKTPAETVGADSVNLEQSLNTFVQVYDSKKNLQLSSGFIGTTAPVVPPGALQTAQVNREDDITWQPATNIRLASTIVYAESRNGWKGFVLAGRSLWEVEKREGNLQTMALLCWLVCMGIICAHALLQGWMLRKEGEKQ